MSNLNLSSFYCKYTFYMYGVLATEPPQPQYVCKNYGKSCKVHAMADVITSASKSLDADSFSTYDDIEICRQPASSFYQFFSQDDDAPSLTCLLVAASRLIAELSQTRAELQKAQEEISRPRLQASSRTIHSDSSLDKLQSLDFLFAAHSFTSWIKSQLMIQLIVAGYGKPCNPLLSQRFLHYYRIYSMMCT